jgi:hypothetical protein
MSRIYRMLVALSIALSGWFVATTAHAADPLNRFCAKWYHVNFVDGGMGEDTWNYQGAHDYPAKYAYFYLTCTDGSGRIGLLDADGCSQYYAIPSGKSCTFTLYSYLSNGANNVVVDAYNPTMGWMDTGHAPAYTTWTKTVTTQSSKSTWYLYTMGTNTVVPRIAAVAGQFLEKAALLNLPVNTTTQIKYSGCGDLCGGSASCGSGNGHVCISQQAGSTLMDQSTYKFVMGHELGHTIAEHWVPSGYCFAGAAYTDPNPLCNCANVKDPAAGAAGCYQSKEYVGNAQSEGLAWFFSAVLFNNRESGSCRLGYFREMYDNAGYPSADLPPVQVDCASDQPWMNGRCATTQEYGTIRDWVNFFWDVWANDYGAGYEKLEIADLKWIFSNTTHGLYRYGPSYSRLLETMEGTYSEPKRNQFAAAAYAAGVAVPLPAISAPFGCNTGSDPWGGSIMNPGEGLHRGESLMSCDGRYEMVLQGSDGHLVIYGPPEFAPWGSLVYDVPELDDMKYVALVIMQGDGNLVIRDTAGYGIWGSGTYVYPGYHFNLQNDGNGVIYDPTETFAPWATEDTR